MIDREKIIEVARKCGGVADDKTIVLYHEELEAFYRAAQAEAFERAAVVCDYRNTIPAAPFAMIKECAGAIRALKEK